MANTQRHTTSQNTKRRTFQARSDINITPLIDVMLVLMIIFMVTAPMLTLGIPVNLPRSSGGQPSHNQAASVVITVQANGQIFLQDVLVEPSTLKDKLALVTANNADAPLVIRGDRSLPYGDIVWLVGSLAAAGYSKVSLVGEASNLHKDVCKVTRQKP